MISSYVINILHIYLCHMDFQMIVRNDSPLKGGDGWHIDFLGPQRDFQKGIKKEGKDPLFEDPWIHSAGVLGWPFSTNKGESQCLDDTLASVSLLAIVTRLRKTMQGTRVPI